MAKEKGAIWPLSLLLYNVFMLTAPENYGIVTAAGKNLLPLKKSWLERPGK